MTNASPFAHSSIGHSDLIRISGFGLRASAANTLKTKGTTNEHRNSNPPARPTPAAAPPPGHGRRQDPPRVRVGFRPLRLRRRRRRAARRAAVRLRRPLRRPRPRPDLQRLRRRARRPPLPLATPVHRPHQLPHHGEGNLAAGRRAAAGPARRRRAPPGSEMKRQGDKETRGQGDQRPITPPVTRPSRPCERPGRPPLSPCPVVSSSSAPHPRRRPPPLRIPRPPSPRARPGRNRKPETRINDQAPMTNAPMNRRTPRPSLIRALGHSDLIRISGFGFRVSPPPSLLPLKGPHHVRRIHLPILP